MSAKVFKRFIEENGISSIVPVELEESTRTAQEAADANGVKVSNIVKSLFLVSEEQQIIVLVPGDRRLDLEGLSSKLGSKFRMADADTVKKLTGYSIGGVPPFGHKKRFLTYIVEGFDKGTQLIAAAGSSNTVFKVDYDVLVGLCEGIELSI